ncbi:MAG: cyclopropane-fatty-acyl-phospholipid synthase family protein [Spirochaetia bacterium]|nr:cyclopropane-fatty-acyl-phospholipid synthase family protein [Spirochaetia bacterium]
MFESVFYRALDRNRNGALVVSHAGKERQLGSLNERPIARINVNDKRFFRDCILFGEVGFGEAFTDGLWSSPDPLAVIDWFANNAASTPTFASNAANPILVNALGIADRIRYMLRPNSIRTSKKNIRDHYDLGNDFFQLFLDETMAYSCAVFKEPSEALLSAQHNKFDRLYEKLNLNQNDHLLEIGCGWGGFAIHAAQKSGCRVTGITISQQQFEFAKRRVREEHLEDQIEIRFQDYREVQGKFDKIVSIEMMEALGYKYLDVFFSRCHQLLRPGGTMALQCITFPDASYESYRKGMDWTRIHIFPGSLLLSVQGMLYSLKKTGNLMLEDVESIGLHYARTLAIWCENFLKNSGQVHSLGFSDDFLRKWQYYFMFCEAGFSNRLINDIQMVLHAPGRRSI